MISQNEAVILVIGMLMGWLFKVAVEMILESEDK